jgi:hypothetical protein
MATQKQIAANRRNAKKSTGPRSESAKAITRMNALRHGLRAKPGAISAESLKELSQIRSQFLQSFQPQNPEQARLIDRMALARWQIMNWERAEAKFLSDPSQTDPLTRLRAEDGFSRRQARYQRAFFNALHEYRRSTAPTRPEPPKSTL